MLGFTAMIVAFLSYVPYFRDISVGKTKPHAFSWLIWGVLSGISFAAQITGRAGPGSWVSAFTTVVCFIIFFLALKKGEKNIVALDWFSLFGAAVAILAWLLIKGPLFSVFLITIIDVFGFLPTYRKSFNKPTQETLVTYVLSGLKYVFALLALNNVSIITALYPASVLFMNWTFVLMLIMRKKQLKFSY